MSFVHYPLLRRYSDLMSAGRRFSARGKPGWLKRVANPLLLLLIVYAWTAHFEPQVFLIFTGVAFLYVLFGVTRVCNAINKDGSYCGRDAYGILRGCNAFKRHRVQARWRFVPDKWWPETVRRCFETRVTQRQQRLQFASPPPVPASPSTAASTSISRGNIDFVTILDLVFTGGSFLAAIVQILIST